MCSHPGFGFHSLPLINRGEKCSVHYPDLWHLCFLSRDNVTDVNIRGGVGMNKNPAVLFLPLGHSSTAINRLTHTQLWFEATAEQLLVLPHAMTLQIVQPFRFYSGFFCRHPLSHYDLLLPTKSRNITNTLTAYMQARQLLRQR